MPDVDVKTIYMNRFSEMEHFRQRMWQVLCADFFQQYFREEDTVVELGAGYCEFINAVRARKKFAVDINPDTCRYAAQDVEVVLSSCTHLPVFADGSVDRVFASNFFEHLEREQILLTLKEACRILKPGGKLVLLQPNYRYCSRDYFMFFDHITPLDDRSMEEALRMSGLNVVKKIARFLPYSTKGNLPNSIALLQVYLKLPFLWALFGAQMFLVAEVSV